MPRNSGIQALLPMKTILAVLIMLVTLSPGQIRSESARGDPDPDLNAVKITNGPVVEHVTETTAIIAWSTNVSAGTVLHYGTDPNHLDQIASMPWGGLTHRVNLKDLTPNTKYYYQAESPKAQGTGSTVQAPAASFKTKPGAACVSACT